jgi:DNA-binding IclR family transcriptional regulator
MPAFLSEASAKRPRGAPTETEIAVLKMIRDSPEKREAPVIAREIGKSREHTARLLKKMSDAGFLARKEEAWPYTYVLTERAQRLLEGQP